MIIDIAEQKLRQELATVLSLLRQIHSENGDKCKVDARNYFFTAVSRVTDDIVVRAELSVTNCYRSRIVFSRRNTRCGKWYGMRNAPYVSAKTVLPS